MSELYGFRKNLERVQVRSKADSVAKSNVIPALITDTPVTAGSKNVFVDLSVPDLANWNVVVLRCRCVNTQQNIIFFRGYTTQNYLVDSLTSITSRAVFYVDWDNNRVRVSWTHGNVSLANSIQILAVYGLVQNVYAVEGDDTDEPSEDEEDIDITALTEEVQGIRIGADGTIYDTAGDAVRGQYEQLAEILENLDVPAVSEAIQSAVDTALEQIQTAGGLILDDTLTQSGEAADAKATGDAITDLREDLSDVYGRIVPNISGWIDGEYIKREDGSVGYNATYHRTDFIEITPHTFINFTCAGNFDVKYNAWYDASKAFISAFSTAQNASRDILVPANAKYMRLSFNKTTTNTIKLSDGASMLKLMDYLCEKNNLYLMPFNNTIYYFGQGIFAYTPTRIGIVIPVTAKTKLKISVDSGYKYSLNKFSSVIPSISTETSSTGWITTDSFVNEGEIFLVNVAKTDDANISPSDGEHLRIYNEDYSERELEVVSSQFTKGMMNADGTLNTSTNGVVSNIVANPLYVIVSSTCRFLLSLYKNGEYIGKINNSGVMDKVAGNWKWFYGENNISQYLIDNGADSARITVEPTDSATITTETAQSYGAANVQVKRYKFVPLDYAERVFAKKQNENPINYLVGSDLLKKAVSVTEMGALSYYQAFCRYNNKYYSIDGSNIAVQDDAFTVEQTATLNTGHGNSLQLGSNGIAYVSGWNDNKIYKVDLENLTVTDVITLPTTGYTTGVVDEVNNIAYIFQRDSYPDTEANYNFIVYDITNQQIKSTKKILAFGAMQSADFFDDKIFVLNGLGTSACPNGYRVYDTSGNILAQYFIGAFSIEPEGVCIDRDTHELYISNVSKKVFKVTSD